MELRLLGRTDRLLRTGQVERQPQLPADLRHALRHPALLRHADGERRLQRLGLRQRLRPQDQPQTGLQAHGEPAPRIPLGHRWRQALYPAGWCRHLHGPHPVCLAEQQLHQHGCPDGELLRQEQQGRFPHPRPEPPVGERREPQGQRQPGHQRLRQGLQVCTELPPQPRIRLRGPGYQLDR